MKPILLSALDMILLILILIISPVVAVVLIIMTVINITFYEIKSKREEQE